MAAGDWPGTVRCDADSQSQTHSNYVTCHPPSPYPILVPKSSGRETQPACVTRRPWAPEIVGAALISPILQMRKGGSERGSDLPGVTQLGDEVRRLECPFWLRDPGPEQWGEGNRCPSKSPKQSCGFASGNVRSPGRQGWDGRHIHLPTLGPAQHFEAHPRCGVYQSVLTFSALVAFHHVHRPHAVYFSSMDGCSGYFLPIGYFEVPS